MERGIMKTKLTFKLLPKDYDRLLALHMLRPVRDPVDYANTMEILDAMAGFELTKDQEDYFEALALLAEAYETEHLPSLPKVKGVKLLVHLLSERDKSAADLAKLLGVDRSLGVRLLNGERNLTVEHIAKLAEYFRLPAELFMIPRLKR
jgi:HTH-type transcriptional regulator/antitoxin HigA